MSQLVARQDIAAAIEAARAAWTPYNLVVEQENRDIIDQVTQVNPYVGVDLMFYDGQQMDLGPAPLVGVYGHILLAVCTQEGKGTSGVTPVMDHMSQALSRKTFSLVKTSVPKPQPYVIRKGWYCQLSLINFWYHELA